MATKQVFKMEGLKELQAKLRRLGEDMEQRIARRATGRAAGVVKKAVLAARIDAPKPYRVDGETIQPGNIRRNIIAKRIPPGETTLTSEHIVTVRSKAHGKPYRAGVFQEFADEYGGVKHPARPFMRPGFEASREAAQRSIVDTLTEEIEKANREGVA